MRLSLAVPNTLSVINSIPCIETSTNLNFILDLVFILINIDIKKSSVNTGWFFFSSFPVCVYYSWMCCNIQKCNEWLTVWEEEKYSYSFLMRIPQPTQSVSVKKPCCDCIKPTQSLLLCSFCCICSFTWSTFLFIHLPNIFCLFYFNQGLQHSDYQNWNKTHRTMCLQVVLDLFYFFVFVRKEKSTG